MPYSCEYCSESNMKMLNLVWDEKKGQVYACNKCFAEIVKPKLKKVGDEK